MAEELSSRCDAVSAILISRQEVRLRLLKLDAMFGHNIGKLTVVVNETSTVTVTVYGKTIGIYFSVVKTDLNICRVMYHFFLSIHV